MGDLVVVLPGIGGSVLQRDHKTLWDPTLPWCAKALVSGGGGLDRLLLDGPDVLDGITATGLIDGVQILPGLWSYGSYSPLTNRLRRMKHTRVLEFPYDWRRSNATVAAQLDRTIDATLAADDKLDDVVVVGHSMGGLVARHYLGTGTTANRCRLLITLGTPYRGAAKALACLVSGMPAPGRLGRRLTNLIRSFPSVYELLPRYDCIVEDDTTRSPLSDHHNLLPNSELFQAATAFHDQIDQQVAAGHLSRVDTVAVVGQQQRTDVLASRSGDEVTLLTDDTWTQREGQQELVRGAGDGTVPRGASQPPEWGQHVQGAQAFTARHVNLPQSKPVINAVEAAIRGREFLNLGPGDEGISLGLDDTHLADEPWTIQAQQASSQLKVDLTVRDLATANRVKRQSLRSVGNGHYTTTVTGLGPGIYEATVKSNIAGAPRTASEIVTVHPHNTR